MQYEWADHFWSYVNIKSDDECWNWQRGLSFKGYGVYWVPGLNKQRGSHRVAWLLTHGEWPDSGLCVCHTCDNPACVNPKHLWLGTSQQNVDDKMAKGRWKGNKLKDFCRKGHDLSLPNALKSVENKTVRCNQCVKEKEKRNNEKRKLKNKSLG